MKRSDANSSRDNESYSNSASSSMRAPVRAGISETVGSDEKVGIELQQGNTAATGTVAITGT